MTIVVNANASLADPDFRASVKQMHAEGYPLVRMVEALGLDDEMTARIREILEGLPPKVVDGIRQATLAALEADAAELPLDCVVTEDQLNAGAAVDVDVSEVGGALQIRVRPGPGG